MTEGPSILRKFAAVIAVATLVGSLSMADANGRGSSSAFAPVTRPPAGGKRATSHAAPPSPPRGVDCAKASCIALTFDDGPVPDTARLLRILKERGVHVTFFVVGQNVAENPGMVRQEIADGHEVGNHTWDHANLVALSTAGIHSQLVRTQEAVQKAAGVTPTVFRPPYGNTNSQVAAVTRQLGLAQLLWEVDPLDWRDHDSAAVQRRIVAGTARGDVVLMHDIHPTTITAVPHILDQLAAKGFVFVTVSELFAGKLVPGKEYTKLEPPRAPTPAATPGATATPGAGPSAAPGSGAPVAPWMWIPAAPGTVIPGAGVRLGDPRLPGAAKTPPR